MARRSLKDRLRDLLRGRGGTGIEPDRLAWIEAQCRSLPPGWRILDAGAGQQVARPFCGHLRYVTQDFEGFEHEGGGLQDDSWKYPAADIVSDIIDIPEPDGAFDAVLCTEVLEHVANPTIALAELARLVRPGGVLLLTMPAASATHFAPHYYTAGFSEFWHRHHLPSAGFEIVSLEKNGSWFDVVGNELRRMPWVVRHYGVRGRRPWDLLAARWAGAVFTRLAKRGAATDELWSANVMVRAERRPS